MQNLANFATEISNKLIRVELAVDPMDLDYKTKSWMLSGTLTSATDIYCSMADLEGILVKQCAVLHELGRYSEAALVRAELDVVGAQLAPQGGYATDLRLLSINFAKDRYEFAT